MIEHKADAEWKGSLKTGEGVVTLGSGAYSGPYSFRSRFEDGHGTNPEELIGAAHAGCFSMALAASLENAGFRPMRIRTSARVRLEKVAGGFVISRIELDTEGEVPGVDEGTFVRHAELAKINCPVSMALAGVRIRLNAKLIRSAA